MSDKSAFIKIESSDWDVLAQKIKDAGRSVAKATDSLAATTAAIGRRSGSAILEGRFNMGRTYEKQYKGRRGTRFDSKLGGYVSRTYKPASQPGGMRESYFNFESYAAQRNTTSFQRATSRVAFQSNVANLWENNTKIYQAYSPWWTNMNGYHQRALKGFRREANPFFLTKVRGKVVGAVPQAIARVDKELQGALNGTK